MVMSQEVVFSDWALLPFNEAASKVNRSPTTFNSRLCPSPPGSEVPWFKRGSEDNEASHQTDGERDRQTERERENKKRERRMMANDASMTLERNNSSFWGTRRGNKGFAPPCCGKNPNCGHLETDFQITLIQFGMVLSRLHYCQWLQGPL